MINKKIDINSIKFVYSKFDEVLYESIKSKGLFIAVKVCMNDDGYVCIDGNKRLSVLKDLGIKEVFVMIKNDFRKAGSTYWGNTRNKH